MRFGNLNINRFINKNIATILNMACPNCTDNVEEIRLRAKKPLILCDAKSDWLVTTNGELTRINNHKTFIVSQLDIENTVELMTHNSIYAYQDDIKNGFITLEGGHRVGITGRIVLDNTGTKSMKDFSGLNIRIARQVIGCSCRLLKYIISDAFGIYNTLIISPPKGGKTTILRDIARNISDGNRASNLIGRNVCIIDERSEIASCYRGVPQNNVGIRTDVLDACPKSIGMFMAIRSMAPHVIITDEIGNESDKESIMQVINAGIKIITSAHGYSISELKTRREILEIIEQKIFERYIVLSRADGPGTLEEVIDGISMNSIQKRANI